MLIEKDNRRNIELNHSKMFSLFWSKLTIDVYMYEPMPSHTNTHTHANTHAYANTHAQAKHRHTHIHTQTRTDKTHTLSSYKKTDNYYCAALFYKHIIRSGKYIVLHSL